MKRFLQTTFILALTVFFLWLFLKNANLRDVWSILRQASPWWLAVAVGANLLALVFRAARWRTLLNPDEPPPFYDTFFSNTMGYMASSLLPVRAADVVRSGVLSRRTTHRFSGAFGTVVTERVLDLGSILLLFVYYVVRRGPQLKRDVRTAGLFNYLLTPAATVAGVALLVLVLLLFGLYFFGPRVRRGHEALGRIMPLRFRGSWMNFFDAFAATLEITKHPAALRTVLFSTAGVWFCLSAQLYLSARALSMPIPFDATFLITGASTIGLAVPTPGGIGGMHKVCQFLLTRFYHFTIDGSVASAVTYHLVGTLPVIVTGLVLLAREGGRWRDVAPPPDDPA